MPIMIRHGGISQTAVTNLINYLCDMGAFDLSHDSFVTEMNDDPENKTRKLKQFHVVILYTLNK